MTTSNSQKLAVFRADAAPEIGTGHVMRTLALARLLAEHGFRNVLAHRPRTIETVGATWFEGVELIELNMPESEEVAALRAHWPDGCELCVIDHYWRGAGFEAALRGWARRIAVVDDFAERRHDCDLFINTAPGVSAEAYANCLPAECVLLLGPAYAPIRPAFAQRRQESLLRRTRMRTVRRVLVSLGATDPDNITELVLASLGRVAPGLAVDVVLGPGAPHLAAVRRRFERSTGLLQLHDTGDEVAERLAAADLAIGAAGVSAWERCVLGLPSLVIPTAGNQRAVAKALETVGAARVLALSALSDVVLDSALCELIGDADLRATQTRAGAALIDGRGLARTVQALDPEWAKDGTSVRLRPVEPADEAQLLGWQQDPQIRRHFRDPRPPTSAEHERWFASRFEAPGCIFNIVLCNQQPAGVIRLELRKAEGGDSLGDSFEVSILTAPAYQGRGVARAALTIARDLVPEAVLHAEVLPENHASHRLFEAAGYRRNETWYVNEPAILETCRSAQA